MNQRDQSSLLYPTRIDIPMEIRSYLVTLLNQTLACTVDLRSQVKHAAWNVKGHVFVQLRVLFETIASNSTRICTSWRHASLCWAG